MDVKQSFAIAVTPDDVWKAFHDPDLLVSCLPGASLREPADDNHLALLFKVKLGPISAAFAGDGELALDETQHTGMLTGSGTDRKSNSRVRGKAAFTVNESAQGAVVELTVTFSITGRLAQFSREGIVHALADQLTAEFADNLQQELKQPDSEEEKSSSGDSVESTFARGTAGNQQASQSASRPATGSPPRLRRRKDTPALNVFSLLWRMLLSYWRKLFGMGSS